MASTTMAAAVPSSTSHEIGRSQQRNSRILSGTLASSSSALASLARGPLVMMNTNEVDSSDNPLALADAHNSEGSTPVGESSNMIIGPGGVLIPRASILMNPSKRKTFVDQWRVSSDGQDRPAPAVLRIPAVPTTKDRDKERERERVEREREIEREVREKEQAERVWGIPKKAFYLGLGEINFNAQMAMLGGWGNGSADVGPLAPTARRRSASSSKDKKKRRASTGTIKSVKEPEKTSAKPSSAATAESTKDGSESDTSIDFEELAQLNAIINTRRSMEAAQKLANGFVVRPQPGSRRTTGNKLESSSQSDTPTPSAGDDASSISRTDGQPSITRTDDSQTPSEGRESLSRRRRSVSDLPLTSEHIRFAPLPIAYGFGSGFESMATSDQADAGEGPTPFASSLDDGEKTLDEQTFDDEYDSGEEGDFNGDESWSRRWSGGKYGKWYMMGMSKGMFSTQNYRSIRRPVSGGTGDNGELSSSPVASKSASGISTSQHEPAAERRGRRSRRPASSRASSIKSRSSSVGSYDEEERERRRQLLRASRPGGTGMLTLPDGTKIRARRVDDRDSDEEEEDDVHKDAESFADDDDDEGKSRRRSTAEESRTQAGEKRTSDDEGGRESEYSDDEGTAASSMKRRRRDGSQLMIQPSNESSASPHVDDADAVIVASPTHENESLPSLLPAQADQIEAKGATTLPRVVKRSVTMPVGGPIPLSATQAAEMRRRHEQEVGALEAEVLHNIAKAKKAKQQEQQQTAVHQHDRHASESKHHTHVSKRQESASGVDEHVERGHSLRNRPRRSTTEDPRLSAANAKSSKHSTSKVSSSPLRKPVRANSRPPKPNSSGSFTPSTAHNPSTPTREAAPSTDDGGPLTPVASGVFEFDEDAAGDLTASVSSLRTLKGTGQAQGAELTASPLARTSSLDADEVDKLRDVRTDVSNSASLSTRSRQKLHKVLSPLDLPRKPDMRGYSVVPLPVHQLGRRPQRPREGRFWNTDEEEEEEEEEEKEELEDEQEETFEASDDDDDERRQESSSAKGTRVGVRTIDESDDDESDMDAEQLAEEERRMAVQKKRATTKAAGAELVSGMTKHKPLGSARSYGRSSSRTRTSHDRLRPELSRSRSSTSLSRGELPISAGYDANLSSANSIGSSSDGRGKLRPTLSTTVLSTSRDSRGNPIAKIHRRRDTWNDFDEEQYESQNNIRAVQPALTVDQDDVDLSDGDDLWPPTLDLRPTASARPTSFHRLSSSTSNTSSTSAAQAISPSDAKLALHSVKARAIREKREREAKERERAKVMAQRKNDDSLDYGWPQSLQGSSLY